MDDHALDFNHLCSFESFRSTWNFYGYDGTVEDVIKEDFARIKGITYLDHAGTTLYPESLIKGFLQDMCSNIYGNPHSNNPSSRLTHDTVERARYRVLQHFNTSPEEYTVIFTSGSTAALKLVAESFPWKAPTAEELGSQFCYLTDNHTSVVGIRAVASASGAVVLPILPEEEHPADFVPISFYKMFGFPTGLGALLVRNSAAEILRKAYFGGGTAAAYLAGEDYYVPRPAASGRFEDGTISFLDIIALHHCFETLQRLTGGMDRIQLHTFGLARYTYMLLSSLRHSNGRPVAQIYSSTEYDDPATQGAILNFSLLNSQGSFVGYSQVDKLASLFNIQVRTGCFCNTGACQLYLGISNQEVKSNLEAGHVCGDNVDLIEGRPTGSVRISFGYMSTFSDCQNFLKFIVDCFVQGPVKVGKENVERLRSTIPSNTQQPFPHLTNGQPNCERREEEGNLSPAAKVTSPGVPAVTPGKRSVGSPGTLANIFLYPIKSCAALEVSSWPLGPLGLLYDRLWMVVNMNGVCLSQKQEPRLCLIRPQIHLATKELSLQAPGMDPVFVPLEGSSEKDLTVQVCQSKVCGDRVQTLDCGERVAAWLSEFLGKPCRLIRQSPNFTRDMKKGRGKVPGESPVSLSLVNEAQYLMINKASIKLLLEHINQRQGSDNHQHSDEQQLIDRFRANLVIWGKEPFEEDDWMNIMIGDTPFKVAGPCGRCQMIGVDQSTGARSQQPLQSLSACRNGKVTFGLYLIHQLPENEADTPTLSIGSPVIPQVSNCSSKAN
ncbi:hypothetical protein MATL_G00256390 [Megalops atlanticus]|uniref:Molybdenum cofactor sulfurase n=1 Tax=Megalops atlanticus TaxID=7932 RepID=A0A9D3PDS1_MEGAT|nr:hypothetical protein MATL_G00256390 [Megalops atlanticus]